MISQNFEYSAPASLEEALELLAGDGARVLAGGMSLVPLMKLRLAAPERLVDLRRLNELSFIRQDGDAIRIGAMTTHYSLESSLLLHEKCRLLAETPLHIGDVQVRNMGTIGGSLAHADPAADYPAALLALEAKVRLVSKGGERTLSYEDFLVHTFSTALEPGEILHGGDRSGGKGGRQVQLSENVSTGLRLCHRGRGGSRRAAQWQGGNGTHRCHRTRGQGIPGRAT